MELIKAEDLHPDDYEFIDAAVREGDYELAMMFLRNRLPLREEK